MLPYSYGHMVSQVPGSIGGYPTSAQTQLMVMERLRVASMAGSYPLGPFGGLDPSLSYRCFDPRARFVQEEPKPQHSYIGLIAMAILSSSEKKLVLSDIYQWILDNYPYFRARGPGWRNSIRHNLSLNDCFIKAGRSANGKGHYWAIHPANVEDFKKGDFRRRRAQRKVRKAMGLAVPDEEDEDDEDSPALTPPAGLGRSAAALTMLCSPLSPSNLTKLTATGELDLSGGLSERFSLPGFPSESLEPPATKKGKRLFDVESLLDMKQGGTLSGEKQPATSSSPESLLNGDLSPGSGNGQPKSNPMGNPLRPLGFPNLSSLAALGPAAATAFSFPPALMSAGFLWSPMLTGNPAGPFQMPLIQPHFTWPSAAAPGAGTGIGSGSSNGQTSASFVDGPGVPPLLVPTPISSSSSQTNGEERAESPLSHAAPAPPSPTSAAKWQESFAKIMARSYQGRQQQAVKSDGTSTYVSAACTTTASASE